MEQLIIVMIGINIYTILAATTQIKSRITKLEKKIDTRLDVLHDDISFKTSKIAIDVSKNKLTKEEIRQAVKNEIAEEVRKLAFTPIKLNR